MKNSHTCPKCGSRDIVRIPDHPSRYASGSNIYTTRYTLLGKVPVIRYVSCGCGYVENWVESPWSWSRSTRPTGLHDSSKGRARSFRARPLPKSTENQLESPCGFCRFCHLTAVDIFPSRCYTETVFFGNALGSGLRRMPQRDNRTDTPRTAAERPERDWDFQPQNRSGGVFCYAFA